MTHKKYIHVVEQLHDSYGGPAKSIPLLCKLLNNNGFNCNIISVNKFDDKNELVTSLDLEWSKCPPIFNRLLSIKFITILMQNMKEADVLHLHSCWSFPSLVFMLLTLRKRSIKVFFSPRSSLLRESLLQKSLLKGLLRRLIVDQFVHRCDAVFCSSEMELTELRTLYPNLTKATYLPNNLQPIAKQTINQYEAATYLGLPPNQLYLTFLSRIHPRKRLEVLVSAWQKIRQAGFDNLHLAIAGPVDDKKYFDNILNSITQSDSNVFFHYLGELTGAKRQHFLHLGCIFVMPSKFESFGMAVAESLSCSVPVITTTATPWHDINTAHAGFCVDINEFERTIKTFLELKPEEQTAYRENARNFIAKKRYDVETIEIMQRLTS